MRRITVSILALAALGLASTASALSASQDVQKETVISNPDGSETIIREAAEMVAPGEKIIYTLNFENDQPEAASNLVLTMPVPDQVALIDGTASKDGAVVTYSADGGESFAARNAVQVVDADGNTKMASAEDITHVRWLVSGPVSAGESGALSFKGTLK